MTCCNLQTIPIQTMFLGCTITNFSTSLQWGDGQSDLSVELVESPCVEPKLYYDSCLNATSGNFADLGFVGEDRYERLDGSQYSSCIKENVSDTKIRDAVNIIGVPTYFRYGSFEYSGIISDWTRTNSTSAPSYRVKIVDPRLILEGVQLIIGDYTGSIAGVVAVLDGGTGEPQTNLFNIYGYLEQFGLVCPSYSQCSPGIYNTSATCPTAIDGSVFGSLVGGFGGSLLNNNGMPYNYIVTGFNFLANAAPAIQNYWSPYGRVSYFSNDITQLNGSGCGLIEPDSGGSYFANKNYYYVDLTELPAFPDNSYRIGGTSISLLDLINKASQDLNFDFYFELLPVKDTSTIYGGNCVAKIIKLRTVARTTQPSLDKICQFIQDSDCILESSIGQELRNETVSKFIIGGKKRSIYQVEQGTNPDGGSASAITSLDSYIGGLRTDGGCSEIDDVVLPYFGLDYNQDLIVPCKVSGFWEFEAPVWGIQGELQIINFSGSTVTINENELRAAAKGYSDWESYADAVNTDIWNTIYPSGGPAIAEFRQFKETFSAVKTVLPHDVVNPKLAKFRENIDPASRQFQEDKEAIYNWLKSYLDYYGKKFAVRVPFTCVKVDIDSLQPIVSERPVNDGGWTEVSGVLDLPNGGPLSFGVYEYLNFFRDDENKIAPFVRFDNAVLKSVGNLTKDSYLYRYKILSGTPASGNGPPSGVPGGSICYQDSLTDIIYVYYFDQWLPINNSCVLHGSGTLPSGTHSEETFCPVYYNVNNGDVKIAGNSTYLGTTGVSIGSWDITASLDLYVKAQVQEEYVYHDKSNYFAPRVVVEIPDAIKYVELTPAYIQGVEKALNAVANGDPELQDNNAITKATHTVGGDAAFAGFDYQPSLIHSAAIPLEHTTQTYGPWYNPTITGRVEIVNDDGLVPWRYNGYAGLNLAATNLANESRVNMFKGELGSITVPGYPTIPLGAELNAINDGYYTGEQLLENRLPQSGSVSGVDYNSNLVSAYYARFAFPSTWTGSYGPNVTDISVSFNNGFQTTYNMRTFAPRRGFFERYRANRIEQLSVRANKVADILREEEKARQRNLLFEKLSKGGAPAKEQHDVKQKHRSVNLIAAQEKDSGTGKRTAVAGMPMVQGNYEIQHEYDSKAFMSWDGFLRPMSMDGDGNLSPFIKYAGTSGILQDDLNPFTNPSGYSRDKVARVRNDAINIGHDFEVLGRSGAQATGLVGQASSGSNQYSNDYRPMALRGPLVMKGWGYDTNGYPVPNKVDSEAAASSGIFETTGLDPIKFLSGHLQKPNTWVVAPIDLRLDRERGVWVAGSGSPTSQIVSEPRDEIILISVTGVRDECCLYKGFHRPLSIDTVNPCNSTLGYEEVYIYHHCDILDPPDCVMGKYKVVMPSSGCHPSGIIYQFLSMATSPNPLITPCDCCCPANNINTVMRAYIQSNCDEKQIDLLYQTGIDTLLLNCTGGNALDAEGFTVPFNGWMSNPFYCNRPYPVILRQIKLVPPGGGAPDVYWARTNYTSWDLQSVYDDVFNEITDLTGYTFSSDEGVAYVLPDINNGDAPIFDNLNFKYRMLVQCPEEATAIESNTISILHMTPDDYPVSGIIPDIGRLQDLSDNCYINTQWFYLDPDFGDGVTCEINVSVAGGSYTFNPFTLHWYCMCECVPSGYPIDFYNAVKDPGVCTVPNVKVRVEWD